MRAMLTQLRSMAENGTLSLDEIQTARLLLWVASAIDKMEQQDRILDEISVHIEGLKKTFGIPGGM